MHQSNRKKMIQLWCVMGICVLGVLLSIVMLYSKIRQRSLWGLIYVGVIVICLWIFTYVRDKYKQFQYGIKGEKEIYLYLSHQLKGDYVLKNVHFMVNHQELEIDTLVIDSHGICIVEVKNYRGTLTGSESDNDWIQEKRLKDGSVEKKQVKNCLHQLERQKRLLASYLRQQKITTQIDGCIYLKIDHCFIKSPLIVRDKEHLLHYISQRQGKRMSKFDMKKVKKLLS